MNNGLGKEAKLTQSLLKELFSYDYETGQLIRAKTINYAAKKGDIPSCIDNRGYGRIKIGGLPYRTHRLIWLYINGEFPRYGIDHIDNNKLNNRIGNLRDVPQSINNKNASIRKDNKSGYAGVSIYKGSKWRSIINVDGEAISLGVFTSLEEAAKARSEAEVKYWNPIINNN